MRIFVLFFLAGTLLGCGTYGPIQSLQTSPEEFLLDKEELVKKYPDIATFEKVWRWSSEDKIPLKRDLIKAFGDPYKVKADWLSFVFSESAAVLCIEPTTCLGVFLVLQPYIPQNYYFEKGNYCIEVKMNKAIFSKYRTYMYRWKWTDTGNGCKA